MHHLHQQLHSNLLSQTTPLPIIPCYHRNNPEIFFPLPVKFKLQIGTLRFHGAVIRRSYYEWRVSAVERESQFEIDADKAREALDELDSQLDSISKKQINPPKIRASSGTYNNLKAQMKIESSEISGSFLTFLAFGLFAFAIFYNILFLTVIKPSIDGP